MGLSLFLDHIMESQMGKLEKHCLSTEKHCLSGDKHCLSRAKWENPDKPCLSLDKQCLSPINSVFLRKTLFIKAKRETLLFTWKTVIFKSFPTWPPIFENHGCSLDNQCFSLLLPIWLDKPCLSTFSHLALINTVFQLVIPLHECTFHHNIGSAAGKTI